MKRPVLHPDIMDLCVARAYALRDMRRLIEDYRRGLENATVVHIENACEHMYDACEALDKAIECIDGVNSLNYERG